MSKGNGRHKIRNAYFLSWSQCVHRAYPDFSASYALYQKAYFEETRRFCHLTPLHNLIFDYVNDKV